MSKRCIVYIKDSPVDVLFQTNKDTNLYAIRTRFLKYGEPDGNMKLQILNNAKTVVLAESESILCNFSDDPRYLGVDATYNMTILRFLFNYQALRKDINYYMRILPNTAYFATVSLSKCLKTVIDYPKPTNVIDSTFETTYKNNFSRYPLAMIQMFGRDFG